MLIFIIVLLSCSSWSLVDSFFFECTFEAPCEDFELDSYWSVNNISSHPDHTYGNLSGHYATYINKSETQSVSAIRTRSFLSTFSNRAVCITIWLYSGPGNVHFEIQLAQGDDEQARRSNGMVTMDMSDYQWRSISIELPFNDRFRTYLLFSNITTSLDIDDLSLDFCNSTTPPPPPPITMFKCDFDQTQCANMVSLPYYTYNWSPIQAQIAQNYTTQAPARDQSTGTEQGHYIWLNNSKTLETGGVGYISTPVLYFVPTDPIYCLNFQYYAFGTQNNNSGLTVLALDEDDERSAINLWPIKPSGYVYVHDKWSWAVTPLPIGNYSLLFRMNSNDTIGSSFAIDSISISSCNYSQQFFSTDSQLQFACDFDSTANPMCNMQNTENLPKPTITFSVRTPKNILNQELGPKYGSGWSGDSFLYWSRSNDTSPVLVNGRIMTPRIQSNRNMCLRFSYFVNSSNNYEMKNNTLLSIDFANCYLKTLWSTKLDTSHGWQLVIIPFYNSSCTDNIYFDVSQEQATTTAVAFDDISIMQCDAMSPLTTGFVPQSTTPNNKSTINYINPTFKISIVFFLFYFY